MNADIYTINHDFKGLRRRQPARAHCVCRNVVGGGIRTCGSCVLQCGWLRTLHVRAVWFKWFEMPVVVKSYTIPTQRSSL